MKNQECYDKNGKFIGWFSRSVAVLLITFAKDKNGKWYVLASQRGEGTPDPELVGAWNCCCGYLDFNETTKQAGVRETFEETGIKIPISYVKGIGWNDNPKDDKRQNITRRMVAVLHKPIESYKFSHKNNEKDEVGEIKWIPIKGIKSYQWAFGHDKIIRTYLRKQKNKQKAKVAKQKAKEANA